MNRRMFAALLVSAGMSFSSSGAWAQAARIDTHTTPTAAEELGKDADLYRQHLTTLSNPFFEGRAPGTRGNRLAADYIEFHLRRIGLRPAFDSTTPSGEVAPATSYRQPFSPPGARPPFGKVTIGEQRVSYGDTTLAPDKDFKVIGYPCNG